METALNESLKTVFKVKELIQTFLDLNDMNNAEILRMALELLEKTEEVIAKTR